METLVQLFPLAIFFLLFLVLTATIPQHVQEQKRRRKYLSYYREAGGAPYVSKWLWERDGMTKKTGMSWEERQEKNTDARMRAELAVQAAEERTAAQAAAPTQGA